MNPHALWALPLFILGALMVVYMLLPRSGHDAD